MRDDLVVIDGCDGFYLRLEADKTFPDEKPAILMTIHDEDDFSFGQICFEVEDAKKLVGAIETLIQKQKKI